MFYVTQKHISRRAMLRGLGGAAIALPFLDAMHPALAQERLTAAKPVKRLTVSYFPHGATDRWLPDEQFNFPAGLAPLDRHKSKMLLPTNINDVVDPTLPEFHDRANATFLTGCEMSKTEINVGISMDQIAAGHFARETQFGSLELSTEQPNSNGSPFFRDAHTMLPVEENPRAVFERLFGDSATVDAEATRKRNAADASALDRVTQQITALNSRLGASDQVKLDQYLTSIRDVERRIQIASTSQLVDIPGAVRPVGIPEKWSDHVKLMFDLQTLAFQADLTRVTNFLYNVEVSLMTFPEIGVMMQHHEASHHNNEQDKLDALHKINVLQSELMAYYIDKLESIKEPSGSLMDNTIVFYGSTLSNPTQHNQHRLPIVLFSGANIDLPGGRFAHNDVDTPIANLHLTLLDRLGVPTEKLGNSTAELKLSRLSV